MYVYVINVIKSTHINEQTTHRYSKLRNQLEWCVLLHPGSTGIYIYVYIISILLIRNFLSVNITL